MCYLLCLLDILFGFISVHGVVGVLQSMRQEVFCARALKNGEKSGDISSIFLDAFHLLINLRKRILSHFYVFALLVLFFHFFSFIYNYFSSHIEF